jgi:hypothetical protein
MSKSGFDMKPINTQLPYSPHLKEIMAELIAVLNKYDVAAHVMLQENGFSEYLLSVDPTWSLLRIENNQIRLRSKLVEDFGGDKEAQKHASVCTANMIRQFADVLARDAKVFEELDNYLGQQWDITHTPGEYTNYRKQ